MSRNVAGNVLEDLTKLSPEEQEKYAEEFCEGNAELKKLLLKLWKSGIQTYACCVGHNAEEASQGNESKPYIFFDVRTLSEDQQRKLFKNIMMISKNLNAIEELKVQVDNYMDFFRHGCLLRLKNAEAYMILNGLFDTILQKETMLEKIQKFLIKKDPSDGLTPEEQNFVKSLVDTRKFCHIIRLNFEKW